MSHVDFREGPVAERHVAAGRSVGASLVEALEGRVVELRHMDDVMGGGDLFPVIRAELASAHEAADQACYAEMTGRRLLVAIGELAQLAGWVASDAGWHAEAQYLYLSGVSAARQANDHLLVGQLLSSLSYQIANVGNPADALLLAQSAVTGVRDSATPVAHALLLERVAWAAARARDEGQTRRVLDDVDDAYAAHSDREEEPEWVYWLDRTEIDVMAGRCLIELGQPVAATPLLVGALSAYAPEHVRERALYQTWLAESYARAGELDAGRESIGQARSLAGGLDSARLEQRISAVENLVALR